MRIFVFVVTIVGLYLIYRVTMKALRETNLDDKMNTIKNTETQYDKVKQFNKNHKNYDKKKKEVDKFKNQ